METTVTSTITGSAEPEPLFRGGVTIELSAVDMNRAVGYWLSNEILKRPVNVVSINRRNGMDNRFAVELEHTL